jgi:hypothetical protein
MVFMTNSLNVEMTGVRAGILARLTSLLIFEVRSMNPRSRWIAYTLGAREGIVVSKIKVDREPSDLVTFPAGMSCTWEIRTPVRKHYTFGD